MRILRGMIQQLWLCITPMFMPTWHAGDVSPEDESMCTQTKPDTLRTKCAETPKCGVCEAGDGDIRGHGGFVEFCRVNSKRRDVRSWCAGSYSWTPLQ